jgi:hypothetical protein
MCDHDATPLMAAYDPERSLALSKAWFNEIINGKEGDFGGSMDAYLRTQDHGQFMASYKFALGPTMAMGYNPSKDPCGFVAPFGVPRKVNPNEPWVEDINQLKRETHYQLQDVMGMNRLNLAGEFPSLSATMTGCTQALSPSPCVGTPSLRSVPGYSSWYYGHK